jgi:hypothetical protein
MTLLHSLIDLWQTSIGNVCNEVVVSKLFSFSYHDGVYLLRVGVLDIYIFLGNSGWDRKKGARKVILYSG